MIKSGIAATPLIDSNYFSGIRNAPIVVNNMKVKL